MFANTKTITQKAFGWKCFSYYIISVSYFVL